MDQSDPASTKVTPVDGSVLLIIYFLLGTPMMTKTVFTEN